MNLVNGSSWQQMISEPNGFYSGATIEDIGLVRIIAKGKNVAFSLLTPSQSKERREGENKKGNIVM